MGNHNFKARLSFKSQHTSFANIKHGSKASAASDRQ
jgi:hypothetical protein